MADAEIAAELRAVMQEHARQMKIVMERLRINDEAVEVTAVFEAVPVVPAVPAVPAAPEKPKNPRFHMLMRAAM